MDHFQQDTLVGSIIGDELLPDYVGIISPTNNKDPYETPRIQWKVRDPGYFFTRMSQNF